MRHFLSAALLTLLVARTGAADAGQAIVERVAASYRSLTSCTYSGSATAFVHTATGPRAIGSTSVVRVKKPNRVFMAVTNPQVGTVTYASDGRTAIAYCARLNQYIQRPAPATVIGVIDELNRAAQPAFGVGISAMAFDPLYFLEGRAPLPGVRWTAKGTASVEGASCDVLVGVPGSAAGFRRATIWADRATHLVRKSEIVLPGAAVGSRVGARSAARADVTLVENAIGLKANPALKDSDFEFRPPKGAVERNIDKYLKKP